MKRRTAILAWLVLVGIWIPSFATDPCHEEFASLTSLPDGTKLEGENLQAVIDGFAHFELNQIQDPAKPSSAIAGLKTSLAEKIAIAAQRSELTEEAIRQRVIEAKQRLVFASGPASRTTADPLRREAKQLSQRYGSVRTFDAHHYGTTYLTFSRDGKRLASTDGTGGVRIFGVATGIQITGFGTDRLLSLSFSPDGNLLLIRDEKLNGYLVAAKTGNISLVMAGKLSALEFAPSGNHLLAARPSNYPIVIAEGSDLSEIRSWSAHPNKTVGATFSTPSGKYVATAGDGDPSIKVWNTVEPSPAPISKFRSAMDWLGFSKHPQPIRGFSIKLPGAFALSDHYLAFENPKDHSISLEPLDPSGTPLSLDIPPGAGGKEIRSIQFGIGGELVLATLSDGETHSWDTETGNLIQSWSTTRSSSNIATSRDGRWIARGLRGGEIEIWERSSGAQ